MTQKQEKSSLDLKAIKMQKIIEREHLYEYPVFLVELRRCLGVTRQSVSYELDMDYDELWRHEEGKMSKRFCAARNDFLAQYYGVEPEILERKFREWVRANPYKYRERDLGGIKADK